MPHQPLIPPRVEVVLLRAALVATAALTAFIGGCDAPRTERLALGDGPLAAHGGYAGGGSETLFDHPEATAVADAYGREALPEYARLDDRMSIASAEQPRLATGEWPQYPAPDLGRVRVVYLPL
ncbi:MAG TPA: hypothetical protein VFF65_03805, partial [Phycisphaerales bacterium]|nr:hypothetical protein [Phycisphaerales bacterium]